MFLILVNKGLIIARRLILLFRTPWPKPAGTKTLQYAKKCKFSILRKPFFEISNLIVMFLSDSFNGAEPSQRYGKGAPDMAHNSSKRNRKTHSRVNQNPHITKSSTSICFQNNLNELALLYQG